MRHLAPHTSAARRPATAVRIAVTYIGTVVGAGFASGQEALRFFVAHGRHGLWGIALATVLLAAFGMIILRLGRRLHARSYHEVLYHAGGPIVGSLADAGVTLFLFAGLVVMLAGGGAIAQEQWGLPTWFGVGVTALLTVLTIWRGLGGLMSANAFIVPLLVLGATGLAAGAIAQHGMAGVWNALRQTLPPAGVNTGLARVQPASGLWPLSAVLFAGYNLILSAGVLAPLGTQANSGRALRWGALGGALGLGALLLSMHLAIAVSLPAAAGYDVPTLYLAGRHGETAKLLYSLVLWAEVYTTAVASAFALARRCAAATGNPGHYRPAAVVAILAALGGSRFGFSDLVATLYPAFGYASTAMLALVARARFRAQR